MVNQADSVEIEAESTISSTVKVAALKAVERKVCSGWPEPADLSKAMSEMSADLSSESKSCLMVLPDRSGVMTSTMTVDLPVLLPPVLGESVKPAAPRGYSINGSQVRRMRLRVDP